jgi:hypothetical protein
MSGAVQRCAGCGAEMRGNFCPSCGQAAALPPPGGGPWSYVGGALVLAVVFALGVLVGRGEGAPAVATLPAPGGPPAGAPDISGLSPRERFDRLYDRVMRASSSGDNATVTQFAPMAISAYTMLDSVDLDARYDVAVIKLHVGDIAGATALADTIVRAEPTHLFGYMLRATVARFSGDSVGARVATAAFLRNYDAERRRARPEYEEHRTSIEAFKVQVTRGG